MDQKPVHRAIIAVDIQRYAWTERTNLDRVQVREALDRMLAAALVHARIKPWQYRASCTGDGQLILIDPAVSKAKVLGPVVARLQAALLEHNQSASTVAQVRLRMVVHAGELVWDTQGPLGEALNFAFRILDSDQARACLRETVAPLVVLVSDWIYSEVVRHRYLGIDPTTYRPIWVSCKETTTRAWLHVPSAQR